MLFPQCHYQLISNRRWRRMILLWCDDCLPSFLVHIDVVQGFFAREGKVGPCVHQFGAQIASPGREPFLFKKREPAACSSLEVKADFCPAHLWQGMRFGCPGSQLIKVGHRLGLGYSGYTNSPWLFLFFGCHEGNLI